MGKFERKAPPRRRRPPTWQQSMIMSLDVVYVLAIVLAVYMLFFRTVMVVGSSMYDTLVEGDRLILLSNVFYQEPEQGDIIVVSKKNFENGECIVKRVIATEGQSVDIDFGAGIVYVDGVALEEPYAQTLTNLEEGVSFPLIVEEGHVFVLGDNRNFSKDSRSPDIGLVDQREIVGKAFFILLPGNNQGKEPADFSRIGIID